MHACSRARYAPPSPQVGFACGCPAAYTGRTCADLVTTPAPLAAGSGAGAGAAGGPGGDAGFPLAAVVGGVVAGLAVLVLLLVVVIRGRRRYSHKVGALPLQGRFAPPLRPPTRFLP